MSSSCGASSEVLTLSISLEEGMRSSNLRFSQPCPIRNIDGRAAWKFVTVPNCGLVARRLCRCVVPLRKNPSTKTGSSSIFVDAMRRPQRSRSAVRSGIAKVVSRST